MPFLSGAPPSNKNPGSAPDKSFAGFRDGFVETSVITEEKKVGYSNFFRVVRVDGAKEINTYHRSRTHNGISKDAFSP